MIFNRNKNLSFRKAILFYTRKIDKIFLLTLFFLLYTFCMNNAKELQYHILTNVNVTLLPEYCSINNSTLFLKQIYPVNIIFKFLQWKMPFSTNYCYANGQL